jgi:hypothetical protein
MAKSRNATKAVSRVERVEVRAVQGKARLAHVLALLGYNWQRVETWYHGRLLP